MRISDWSSDVCSSDLEVVFEEGIDPAIKDLLPILAKAVAARPDVLVLQLHAGSTALDVRQAKAMGPDIPIVAGSAMHQPQTAALLERSQERRVGKECVSTGSYRWSPYP